MQTKCIEVNITKASMLNAENVRGI